MSAELLERSASELTRDLATRQIRVTELMAACLARIDEVNPALNAIYTVDAEPALAAAADGDGHSRGEPLRRPDGCFPSRLTRVGTTSNADRTPRSVASRPGAFT